MNPILIAVIAVVLLLATSATFRTPRGIRFTGLGDASPLIVRILVSFIVLGAGLYVILSHDYQVEDKKWGYGIVGTVVGYWLKG